jgi:predicted aldo/keto reductase-like oxidoreductase
VGLKLPEISLGLWHNFGHDRPLDDQRAIVRRAFDLGVTHFDLANNYGRPYGSAEETFGQILRKDLARQRLDLRPRLQPRRELSQVPHSLFAQPVMPSPGSPARRLRAQLPRECRCRKRRSGVGR